MKNFFIILFILWTSLVFSQNSNKFDFSKGIKNNTKQLLPEGKFIVGIMQLVGNPRYGEIALKFQKSIQANYDWFVEYIKQNENIYPLPYHESFGITREEYSFFLTAKDNLRFESRKKEELIINHENNIISFKINNEDELEFLNYLTINLNNSKVILEDIALLSYLNTSNIKNNENALKST